MARQRAKRKFYAGIPVADFDVKILAVEGSVHDLIHRHLVWLSVHHYAATTVEKRRSMLLQWAAWCLERGLVVVKEIERRHLERYQAFLFAYRKPNGDQLSIRTQTQRLTVLRLFFTWAVKQHFVPANPAADLELPRKVHTLPVHLSPDEVRRVLAVPDPASLEGLRDRALMELLYSTGMRRSEAAKLTLEDLHPQTGLVMIRQGKGRKDRLIPVGDRALNWLDRYQLQTRCAWLQDPAERAVFLRPDGCALTPDNISLIVRHHLKTAEIHKRGCCHLFRHTFATELLSAGCDMRYIRDMLGHVSMDTTAHYAQVAVDKLKAMHSAFHPAESAVNGRLREE